MSNENTHNDEERNVDRDWTLEDLADEAGYKTENVAAYKSPENGVVVPVDFVDGYEGPPPETLDMICGTRWGGSGEVEELELVSNGFIDDK